MTSLLDIFVYFFFILSLLANALLMYYISRKPKRKDYTYDCQALLKDLSTGPALIKVEYVDRQDVLLRSPRHT